MKKIILKTALCLSMCVFFAHSAFAFAFTDISALAQRAIQFVQTAAHYAQSVQHFNQFFGYVQEFNNHRRQFESYYRNFNRVYRQMSSSAYYRDFNPSNWRWTRIDDHLLRVWRRYNHAAWEVQMLAIRTSRLYETNPIYRRYADRLIALSEEQVENLRKEEAYLQELEAKEEQHMATLERLRNTNHDVVTADGEISLSHQIALTNAILLELAAVQAESRAIEQRLLTLQRDQQNLIAQMKQFELEAQRDDGLNLDFIFNNTIAR